MRAFFNSLSLKIGGIIVLVEVIALTIAGIIYLNNFSAQVDTRRESTVSLPAKLMNAGLLDLNAINNADTMRELIGEDVRNAQVAAINQVVFFSSNPDDIGKAIQEIDGINLEAFNQSVTAVDQVLIQNQDTLTYVAPVFAADGRTPRFYVYIEVSNAEAIAQKSAIAQLFILGTLMTVAATSVIIFFSFNITVLRRILDVVGTLKRVEDGDLSARVNERASKDEIGQLQLSVNSMASRLQNLVEGLEERVTARTRDLAVVADVSLRITTILDNAKLLKEIVTQTAQGFTLYHVSIFLFDEETRRLRYEAGNGDVGEILKAEHKSFTLNDAVGLVPLAAQRRKAVVVNDVTRDPNHFKNAHLPHTRSEATLPIIVAGELIGVLDLQSEQVDRFKDDDLRIMTLLAEQIGIAVQNARLYANQVKVADKLQALDNMKSQFLASMSHELRTPLNAILNFARFILMGLFGATTDKQRDGLEKIISSAEHLLSLINDVLDVTKIESGMLQLLVEDDVNLETELRSVISTAESLVSSKPIQLIQDIDDDLPLLVGDRRRIRQILLNVISNACKFTESGTITISANTRGDEIMFAVIDTGLGIAADDLDIIFEPFQQTEHGIKHAGGTGLGLPISKKLVEAHEGRLWVESEVGEGSSFYVTLPIEPLRLLEKLQIVREKV